MRSNIKTVLEEHLLSENVYSHLYSASRWSDDEVASYVNINKQTSTNIPKSKRKLFKK